MTEPPTSRGRSSGSVPAKPPITWWPPTRIGWGQKAWRSPTPGWCRFSKTVCPGPSTTFSCPPEPSAGRATEGSPRGCCLHGLNKTTGSTRPTSRSWSTTWPRNSVSVTTGSTPPTTEPRTGEISKGRSDPNSAWRPQQPDQNQANTGPSAHGPIVTTAVCSLTVASGSEPFAAKGSTRMPNPVCGFRRPSLAGGQMAALLHRALG